MGPGILNQAPTCTGDVCGVPVLSLAELPQPGKRLRSLSTAPSSSGMCDARVKLSCMQQQRDSIGKWVQVNDIWGAGNAAVGVQFLQIPSLRFP